MSEVKYSKILYADKQYGELYRKLVEIKLAMAEFYNTAFALKNSPNRLMMAKHVCNDNKFFYFSSLTGNKLNECPFALSSHYLTGSAKEKQLQSRLCGLLGAYGSFSGRLDRLLGIGFGNVSSYLDWATGKWTGGRYMTYCLDPDLKKYAAEIETYYSYKDWWSLANEVADAIYPKFALEKLTPILNQLRSKYQSSQQNKDMINGNVNLILQTDYWYYYDKDAKLKPPSWYKG